MALAQRFARPSSIVCSAVLFDARALNGAFPKLSSVRRNSNEQSSPVSRIVRTSFLIELSDYDCKSLERSRVRGVLIVNCDAWRLLGRSLGAEILHQEHIVSVLTVNELVDQLLCQKNSESSRPHTLCIAIADMTDRVTGRICHRCVRNFIQGKTIARIADPAGHHVAGTDIADFNRPMGS